MDLSSQKRIAADVLKCGITRVRITADGEAMKEVEEALTREDIRALVRKGLIIKVQKKGTSSAGARKIRKQKSRGRRKGTGSRKGRMGAREPGKPAWMKKVRALRALLRGLKESGSITNDVYRDFYMKVKGGMFRNKKHLLYYLKDHELLKKRKKPEKKEAKPKKAPEKVPARKPEKKAPVKAEKPKKGGK